MNSHLNDGKTKVWKRKRAAQNPDPKHLTSSVKHGGMMSRRGCVWLPVEPHHSCLGAGRVLKGPFTGLYSDLLNRSDRGSKSRRRRVGFPVTEGKPLQALTDFYPKIKNISASIFFHLSNSGSRSTRSRPKVQGQTHPDTAVSLFKQ